MFGAEELLFAVTLGCAGSGFLWSWEKQSTEVKCRILFFILIFLSHPKQEKWRFLGSAPRSLRAAGSCLGSAATSALQMHITQGFQHQFTILCASPNLENLSGAFNLFLIIFTMYKPHSLSPREPGSSTPHCCSGHCWCWGEGLGRQGPCPPCSISHG